MENYFLVLVAIVVVVCRRHYKVTFDIDPGYIFQSALTISFS